MTTQLPAYLQNRTSSRNLAATLIGNLGSGAPPYISIRNNKFAAIDSTGAEKPIGGYNQQPDQFGAVGPYIDVVIADINEHTSKVWFEKAFDPNGDWVPPECFSDNGIGPSRNASKPQSSLCSTCPKNVWGSAVSNVSGKGIKACHDMQKMAFVVPGDEIVYQFRLPPNSRGNLRNYVLRFQGQAFDIADVVTRIWFDQNTIGTLLFAPVGFMDEATVAQRDKALAEKKTDNLVGRGDLPVQQALPAPTPAPHEPAVEVMATLAGLAFNAPSPAIAPQAAPFAPPAAAAQPMPSTAQSAASAAPAANSASAEPQRRRRRTNAQIAADNAAAQQQQGAPVMAGTSQPAQQAPVLAPFAPQATATAPAPQAASAPAGQFGIQEGLPPSPDMMSALAGVFGKN